MRKFKVRYLLIFVPIMLFIVFSVYIGDYYKAMPEAKATLASTDKQEFKGEPWLEFTGNTAEVKTGLIIYPGGKVEEEAYAPLAKCVAETGYKVIIVPMPFKLAVFSPEKADEVIEAYPDIKEWYIGGHSLGGVMAASYAYKNQDKIQGLMLLASYPQEKNDLSHSKLKVLSIYGTNDGFIGNDKIESSKILLPESTIWLPIEGGNHSQMGYYGFQKGDQEANISREEQQEILTKAILGLLSSDE